MKDALGHGSDPRGTDADNPILRAAMRRAIAAKQEESPQPASNSQAAQLLAQNHPTKTAAAPTHSGMTQEQKDKQTTAWDSAMAMSKGDMAGAEKILRAHNEKYPVPESHRPKEDTIALSRSMNAKHIAGVRAAKAAAPSLANFMQGIKNLGKGK